MKKRILFISMLVLMAIVLSSCAGAPLNEKNTRSMSVAGRGEVYLIPDIAYINVGTRSEALDVATALADNNKQAQAISAVLTEMGIDPLDIQTTAFNVYPYQNYGMDGQPADLKYVVENTVNVKVRNLNSLGEVLDAVVKSGANQIYGISFDVEDRKQAEADARRLAIQDATEKAQELAGLTGITLGEILNISVYSNGSPQPVFDAKGGGYAMPQSAAPIAAGQMIITADANLVYTLK
ncbi:MAG TPA: SIMPL domain-containing protein [Anaerolineaceae bacterium]|nr:SIMPL domain-containing protein [Anaerolineaceae bacterium]